MTAPGRGRPRSEESRRAILEATRDALADVGYDGLTFDGIAKASGTSRQTIYRWWNSRAALVADAVVSGVIALPQTAIPHTGNLRDDLTMWSLSAAEAMSTPLLRQVVRAMASAAADDESEAARLYEQLTGVHHARLVARIHADPEATLDAETVVDALLGAALFRTLTPRGATADPAALVRAFFPPENV